MTRTITLRPNEGIAVDPNEANSWAPTGTGSRTTAVSDSSGSTFIVGATATAESVTFGLETAGLSGVVSAARVGFTQGRLQSSAASGTMRLLTAGGSVLATRTIDIAALPESPANVEYDMTLLAPYEVREGWSALPQSVVDDMRLYLLYENDSEGSASAATWVVYETYVDIDIEDPPPGVVPVGF